MMLLLDTNVISEVRKSSCDPNVLAWMTAQSIDTMYISAITVLEIQRGISRAEQRGDALQAGVFSSWLEGKVLPAFAGRILPVDHLIAQRAAQLPWSDAKDYRDPIIAATGLIHGATVATRNTKHFESSGVPLVNPWETIFGK